MKAAVSEAVAAAPEPRRPPPKLGPADTPPLAAPPRAAPPRAASSAVVHRRTGWGYAIVWALGIGVGAVAAGAFVGFLVNGPPGHSSSHRTIADVAPPTPNVPPPTAQEIVNSKSAPTSLASTAPASASPSSPPAIPAPSAATPSARMVLPPIPPAKPAAQQPAPPPPPAPRLSSNDVREVQGRLQSLGFDPGPVDGAAGPKTAAAVARYQEAHGLPSTGVADTDTLDELRREPGSTPPPPPSPPRAQPRASQYAYSPPPRRDSNPFVDAINRLFGR